MFFNKEKVIKKKKTALRRRLLELEKQKNKKKGNKFFLILKRLFLFFLLIFFISSAIFVYWVSTLDIPDISLIRKMKVAQSTKIYDKNGELLYRLYDEEDRTIKPLKEISKNVQHAIISIEDKDFYNHQGIKPTSILKAFYENLTHKRRYVRGGSTITQQVIKNTILTPEKTITRKVKELILAYKLEKLWSKDQILETYLNEVGFGGTLYGIEEASQYFFGVPSSDLSIAQSAYLAAMPQAPTRYSPYGHHKVELENRKNLILKLMLQQGYITYEEYKKAIEQKPEFVFKKRDLKNIKAPHFVMYIVDKLKKQFGEDIRTIGYSVYTSLDWELQKKIETIVQEKINDEILKLNPKTNAGVVIIDTKTGHILSMVGSRDYFDEDIDGKYNITTALRQPGSSFKPIVYYTALNMGYTPDTVLWDTPTEFSLNPRCKMEIDEETNKIIPISKSFKKRNGCYRPNDFDFKFRGPMTLKEVLPQSLNIPAVKVLYLVGVSKALNNARNFGITTLNRIPSYYGLNLVLGGGEVKLLDLTSVYGMFANEGIKTKPVSIIKIQDSKGKDIFESKTEKVRVAEVQPVRQLNKILSNWHLKAPIFGVNSPMYFKNREVAVKSGTTNDSRDFWTMGYDPGHVAVGVWVGDNENKPFNSFLWPGNLSKRIWKDAMTEALKQYPYTKTFAEPIEIDETEMKPVFKGIWQGDKSVRIDTNTGKMATEDTPDEFTDEIIVPDYHSILYYVNRDDPHGTIPEQKDPAFENWEIGIKYWQKANEDKIIENREEALIKLAEYFGSIEKAEAFLSGEDYQSDEESNNEDNQNYDKGQLDYRVFSPGDGDTFRKQESIFVKAVEGDDNIKLYNIYWNGDLVAHNKTGLFNLKISDINEDKVKESNVLKIEAISVDNKKDSRMKIINIK